MSNPSKSLKKPDIYVVARFLERLWRGDAPIKKTRLQMSIGLNYTTFKKYVEWMLRKKFIVISKERDGHEYIRLTSKGVDAYYHLVLWLKDVIDND
ncbi:winged helix-turn-helix domain-containing protein [[Eubacterium] cellulosolvens]